jgi:hypothetical protein
MVENTEIQISRQLMMERSPYFRELCANLDLAKVCTTLCD